MCHLAIPIINKCFELQNDWFKIIRIGIIARNFVLYHSVKEIKNLEQQRNCLSDMHQNLISSNLYQGATEYKVSSISAH